MSNPEIEYVHAAAAPFSVTRLFSEKLGDGPENMVFHHGFNKSLACEVRIFRAAFAELLFVHFPYSEIAFCNRVAMAAMGGGYVIGKVQSRTCAGRSGFLSD